MDSHAYLNSAYLLGSLIAVDLAGLGSPWLAPRGVCGAGGGVYAVKENKREWQFGVYEGIDRLAR